MKILNWLKVLLSDDHQISSRRFIALQAFYLIVVILLIAISFGTKGLANIELIKQIELHLFYITLIGIFGVTTTDLARIMKSSTPTNTWDSYRDIFKGTQDDIDTPENP